MQENKLKHIELFAGCGGMSLGLDAAGFDLYFANELSAMASETFAFNLLGENLQTVDSPTKTLWIKSQYKVDDLNLRLRENPNEAVKGMYSDTANLSDLEGKLVVGDIDDLLKLVSSNSRLLENLQKQEIDLISGGPPCQSFSLAGKREKDNYKNKLPLSFARFVGLVKPKVVLLENVKGILSPFIEDEKKHYAWIEVAKAFALQGYVPVCMLLNSKYFGVAQNRPRFILTAYREDLFNKITTNCKEKEKVLSNSKLFYSKVIKSNGKLESVSNQDLNCYDIELDSSLFDGELFPMITRKEGSFISATSAIGDIRRTDVSYKIDEINSDYANNLNTVFNNYNTTESRFIKNHEPRQHRYTVKARFRFYQVIGEFKNGLRKSAIDLFTGKKIDQSTKEALFKEFSKHNLYFKNGIGEFYKRPSEIMEVENIIKQIPTKKHSQRALKEFLPAPAQLTAPDDLCHYHIEDLRTMTVREMARFQSFPDWFEFRSKITTGGNMRKFEVPQYTQVGNAVPPLLAKVLGDMIKSQLDELE